jgi:hypothetical protein
MKGYCLDIRAEQCDQPFLGFPTQHSIYMTPLCFYLKKTRSEEQFFAASGVQLVQTNRGQFHYHRTQVEGREHPRQDCSTTDYIKYRRNTYSF